MIQFIPANLHIQEFVNAHPPTNIKNFNIDKLTHIISLVISIPANNKDLLIKNGFIPFYSPYVQRIVKNYRSYLDYLLEHKIFLSNNHYVVGETSKGYKYSSGFCGAIKAVTNLNAGVVRLLKRQHIIPPTKMVKYKHIIRWYDEFLKIDYPLALSFIDADLKRKQQNPLLRDLDKKPKKNKSRQLQYKDPQLQYNSARLNLERIHAGEFILSIDDNVKRFHSTISNFRSELRKCISYGGRKLISVDIKNSQPLISTIILNFLFWVDKNQGENSTLIRYNNIINKSDRNIFNFKNTQDSYVMLAKSAASIDSSDLHRFIELVKQGTFYEYLEKEIGQELGIEFKDRQMVKRAVFLVLFTDNRYLGQDDARPKKIFKQLFPTVYKLFNLIKKCDKSNLPVLLQRIESHLMIMVISKRIAKERHNLPILTIHDSIVTTEGNEQYVKSVIEEEMIKAIGFAPKLHFEIWDSSTLKFSDGTKYLDPIRVAV